MIPINVPIDSSFPATSKQATPTNSKKIAILYNKICFLPSLDLNITKILKSNGISKEEIIKRGNDSQGRPLYQLDKKTNEILEKFDSVAKAAQYLKDNNISKDTIGGISAHICQCCNGIRKTAYGFIWQYIK